MYTFLVVCLHKMYTTLQIFVLAKALEDKTPPPPSSSELNTVEYVCFY